jgi:hypothetical protein
VEVLFPDPEADGAAEELAHANDAHAVVFTLESWQAARHQPIGRAVCKSDGAPREPCVVKLATVVATWVPSLGVPVLPLRKGLSPSYQATPAVRGLQAPAILSLVFGLHWTSRTPQGAITKVAYPLPPAQPMPTWAV